MYSVYTITCRVPEVKDVYIGITKDMRMREIAHKSKCKSKGRKVYKFIREHGGWENWEMTEIEKTDDKTRERYWIEELRASLNDRVPGRTKEEYTREWYQQNIGYNRNYYETNKEQIKVKKREYQEVNKEKIKVQRREYREANKEKINQHQSQKITCECGGTHTHIHKARHLRTKKHQDYLTNLNDEQTTH